MIETESGFYFTLYRYLFYADKANMDNWVLVCSEPDCEHIPYSRCSAYVKDEKIISYNGRILKTAMAAAYPELYSTKHPAAILLSMAPDGRDYKLEYVFEDALNGNFSSDLTHLSSDQWLYFYEEHKTDGTRSAHLYRITQDGPQLVKSKNDFEGSGLFVMNGIAYGVTPFWSELLDNSGELRYFYYYQNEELKPLDLAKLPSWGCYISNHIARGFSYTQGAYYDYDLQTGQQYRIADPQLEKSNAVVVLPNCIIESTLIGSVTTEGRKINMTHGMQLYDGTQWHEVLLPVELEAARMKDYLKVICVASDRILLRSCNAATEPAAGGIADTGYVSTIYQIMLDADQLTLDVCGQLEIP